METKTQKACFTILAWLTGYELAKGTVCGYGPEIILIELILLPVNNSLAKLCSKHSCQ